VGLLRVDGLAKLLCMAVTVQSSFLPDPEASTGHTTNKVVQHSDKMLRLHRLYFLRVAAALRGDAQEP